MPININDLEELSAAESLRKQLLDQQLVSTMGGDLTMGLGLGVGGVGLYQLAKMLTRPKKRNETRGEHPQITVRRHALAKQADKEKQAGIAGVLGSALGGTAARNVNELPYGLSARAVALLAGLGGGAFLTGKLTGKAKAHAIDKELENAQAEFEAALNDTGQPQMKLAMAFERIEKAAESLPEVFPDGRLDKQAADNVSAGLGQAMGIYALLAMLASGTGGYYGYKAGLKGQKARRYDLANAARLQRQKIENPSRPIAILADESTADEEPYASGF